MRAEVEHHDVAVWRGPEGDVHVWNNRCPHRGMRLSHGFVRGDKLACLYHGWHYGKTGGCTYIPAHPDLEPPATIAAEVYHVVEANGVIWASIASTPDAPMTDPQMKPLRSLSIDCAPDQARAAFLSAPLKALPRSGKMTTRCGLAIIWSLCFSARSGTTQPWRMSALALRRR
jgi:phenylpropionate dioxygenase-like ring-hydroxylating dioxygenase large terminal subunit